jgi:hypothetical protein
LAQPQGQAESTCVPSKGLANVHPQDRKQSRILVLRVIIRGGGTIIHRRRRGGVTKSCWRR